MALEGFSIQELQANIARIGAEWEAGENRFTEMSSAERALYLGYVPGPDEPSLEERERIARTNLAAFQAAPRAVGYPISYDLRNVDGKNFITPVKSQESCGSCVAFGVAATVEGRLRKQQNDPNLAVDYSEAHLFYCYARNEGMNCSTGWWTSSALNAFQQGVVDESCFPYTAGDRECSLCSDWQSRLNKITSWNQLSSTTAMKEWISTKGPLVACFTVYDDFFAYNGGIYRHVTGDVAGGHCVSCVGYNDEQQYWICKNSWGQSFGENGYFRIGYGECGIDSYMDTVEEVQVPVKQKKIALQAHNGQYVCAQGGGGREVVANRDRVDIWETFKLIKQDGNKIALQAHNGQYVCAEGGGGREVVANRNRIGRWETFKLIELGDSQDILEAQMVGSMG